MFAKKAESVVESGCNFGAEDIEEKLVRNPEARFASARRPKLWRLERRLRVGRCEHRLEKQRYIWHGSGHGAEYVERGRKWDYMFGADAAETEFQPDGAAKGRRNTNGAAGVRADTPIAEAGGERRGGAAAGTTANARKIPGIMDRAEV